MKIPLLVRMYVSLLVQGAVVLSGYLVRRVRGVEVARAWLREQSQAWTRGALASAGVRVTVQGAGRVPQVPSLLYVANHQSALDIPIMVGYLPGSPAFVAKRELFRIPILGFWMRLIDCVPLNRDSPRAARDAIHGAAVQVRQGRRMVLFPEGTRTRDPQGKIAPFKPGSLKLAAYAEAVVVPVTIEGTRFLLGPGNSSGGGGDVRVVIGPPIAVRGMTDAALKGLPAVLHRLVAENFQRIHMGEMSR